MAAQLEEGKSDDSQNNQSVPINAAATSTRRISFHSSRDWGRGAISACNEWLEQCKDDIKIQNISTIIRNQSNKDLLYYFVYVTYTIDKQGGNGWNIDGYKTRLKLFYSTRDWGAKAEKECNE